MDTQQLRDELYARSPFDLASDSDNVYRDMVDFVLNPTSCAHCGEIMECLITRHAHTEKNASGQYVDVTEKKV